MKAPIAEVPEGTNLIPRKKPFLGLNIVCGLLFVLLAVECVNTAITAVGQPATDISLSIHYLSIIIGLALFRLPFFIFVFFLRRGYNWARIALLIACLLSCAWATTDLFRGYISYKSSSFLVWIFDWFLCLFLYVFLPIWLNLPHIRRHFRPVKNLKDRVTFRAW